MNAILKKPLVDRKAVLTKAVLNAANELNINQNDLAAIIGVHRTAISKFKKNPDLDPESKSGELALLFIRLHGALLTLNGGDLEFIHHFLNSPNRVTGGVPVEQIKNVQGLVRVVQFLDALRGKI